MIEQSEASQAIHRRNKIWPPLLLLGAAALAVIPVLAWGISCGHDFDFHALSWIDALASWRHGILYPRWAMTPNFGTGEPRFVFYPPFTWMLGAAIGALLPWKAVPTVVAGLLLAAIGLATRALAREVLDETSAVLAGCFAIFSGYALFTVYERSAYAELGGGIWIPLLLMFMLREGRPRTAHVTGMRRIAGGSALPLALLLCAAWLTNAPVGVMASYLLAATALTVAILARSWTPVLRATTAAILGLGLASFYLVPAAWEQRWADIRQATDDPGLLVQNSFLFARHHVPALEDHDIELAKVSGIAVSMVALALLAIAICFKKRRLPGNRNWWLPLALIPVAVLLLQLPISMPVWQLLPKMRFLQFPWRWLLVLEAPMAIFIAAAINGWPRRRRLAAGIGSLLLAGGAFGAGFLLHQSCDAEDTMGSLVWVQSRGTGVEGTDEYAPPGADNSQLAIGLPGGCLVENPAQALGAGDPDLPPVWSPDQASCLATATLDRRGPGLNSEHRRLTAALPQAGYLVLGLRRYPAWRIQVNGRTTPVLNVRQDGLMVVPVPAGAVTVSADWTTTPDVVWGRWMSLAALLLLGALAFMVRRAKPAAGATLS